MAQKNSSSFFYDLGAMVLLATVIGLTFLLGHPEKVTVTNTNAPNAYRFGLSVGTTLLSLSQSELNTRLDDMVSLGVGWVRFDIDWSEIQPTDARTFNWTNVDRLVRAAASRNIKLLAIVDYTPAWARAPGCSSSKCPPADNAAFAVFARTAAARFGPLGIHNWEVWNEPNLAAFWQPRANANAYAKLLTAASAAIKSADSGAIVISGGTGPASSSAGDIAPVEFLKLMYANDAGGSFDAVGYHPYSFPGRPSRPISTDGWSQMSSANPSLRSVMTANGDGAKQIWLTEFGAPTGGPRAVTEALQAGIIGDALILAPTYPWAGPLFIYSYKDLGTAQNTNENFFGILRFDGSQKPAYETLKEGLPVH